MKLWATVNEPYFEAWLSHYDGAWPPGGRNLGEAVAALHHLLLGHGLAVTAARAAAPGAIDVTLAHRGRILTFMRSLQVDGGAPLELNLRVGRIAHTSLGFSAVLLLGIAGIAALQLRRKTTY